MPTSNSRPVLDVVGKPLKAIAAELAQLNHVINYTYPPRRSFPLLEDDLYVLRQRIDEAGVLHLIAGAKMGKEA